MEALRFIFTGMTAIGTFLAGVAAIMAIPKVMSSVMFRNETLYGEEAEERYKYMKATMPKNHPGAFGPVSYGGGRLNTPKFEISKYLYDKQTMGPEYKGFKREARYYYEKDGVTTVEGWRLK